jgi:hypothetical protein
MRFWPTAGPTVLTIGGLVQELITLAGGATMMLSEKRANGESARVIEALAPTLDAVNLIDKYLIIPAEDPESLEIPLAFLWALDLLGWVAPRALDVAAWYTRPQSA